MNSQYLKTLKIPDKPGVYFFLDKNKKPIYIGKATSLRDRIRSYFGKNLLEARSPLIADMVFKAAGLKWTAVDSVLEALILEANLIKKHQPKYNTKEKDNKSFNYVCITDEELPKVVVKRGKDLADFVEPINASLKVIGRGSARPFHKHLLAPIYKNIFGPYTSGSSLREALKIVRKIFPFLNEKSAKKDSYEFYRQIGLVPDLENKKEYLRNIKNLKLFFEGKKTAVLSGLQKEMNKLAKEKKFEEAGRVRNQIFALKHIQDVALIKDDYITAHYANGKFPRSSEGGQPDTRKSSIGSVYRIEAYDVAHLSGQGMAGVMAVIENGEAEKNEYRKFKIKTVSKSNDPAALLEILERRFSHPEWNMPNLIVVDGGRIQMNVALNFQKKVGLAMPVVAVTKDEKHRPVKILGDKKIIQKHEKEILLANHEAHRFSIAYHRNLLRKRI